jgi:glycosyltransferase involved in cell wall biosynthesis
MKQLLIYIPTFERSEILLKQLQVISNQKSSEFDVIVSNNGSSDKGYFKVADFCNKNDFIYSKLPTNIGVCSNIINAFLYVNHYHYIWILSDDDLLKVDSITKTLKILQHDIDFLWFIDDEQMELKILEVNSVDIDMSLKKGLGLLSALIYKCSYIKDNIYNGYNARISYMPHLAIYLSSIRMHQVAKVCIVGCDVFFHIGEVEQEDGLLRSPKMLFGFPHLCEYADTITKGMFLKDITSFSYVRYYVEADYKFYDNNKEIAYLSDLSFGYLTRNSKGFLIKYLFWNTIYPLYNLVRTKISLSVKLKILKLLKRV